MITFVRITRKKEEHKVYIKYEKSITIGGGLASRLF